MGNFFKEHKVKIIVGLVAVLLGAMLYSASADGVNNIGNNLIQMITKPVLIITSGIGNAIDSFFNKYIESGKYLEENIELKKEIDELNKKIINYDQIKQENESLRKIAGIKEKNPNNTYIPANIISRDTNNMYSTFTIDKGSSDGVKINDPIITQSGLVGVVTVININSAVVTTILNPKLNVGVYSPQTKEIGIISGDTALSSEGKTILSILSKETNLKKGDLLVTSGSSGIYPKDLVVGKVLEVMKQDGGVTLKATVELSVNIIELKDVVVITKFEGQGSFLDGLQ